MQCDWFYLIGFDIPLETLCMYVNDNAKSRGLRWMCLEDSFNHPISNEPEGTGWLSWGPEKVSMSSQDIEI